MISNKRIANKMYIYIYFKLLCLKEMKHDNIDYYFMHEYK